MTLVSESAKTVTPTPRENLMPKAKLESSMLEDSIPEMVVLEGVSWATYEALVNETGDERKVQFAYNNGVLTIDNSFVVLEGVSWATYEALVKETGDERKARFAYSDGALEIAMPLKKHENIKHILERIIVVFSEELNLDLKCYGSATFNRKKGQKGVEPDSCFYIQSLKHLLANQEEINSENLPPDLIVEVDISHRSTTKIDIYAALGALELWRFQNDQLYIYHLIEGQYESSEISMAFPLLTAKNLNSWLAQHNNIGDNTLIRSVRKWLREQLEESS